MKKALLVTLLLTSNLISFAQAVEVPNVRQVNFQPEKLLIIGNSYMYYNCGINGYLGGLLKATGKTKAKTRIATIGRGNLSQYPLEEYLDNSISASHSKNATISNDLLEKEIKKREKYDLVLMQASNRGKADQMRDQHYIKIHAKAIRDHGAEPALILTWTQKLKNAPEFSEVQEWVTKIGNENQMMVIPVGLAFNRVSKKYPDLKLIMPDNTHPTAIGSYLMAATIYASIYQQHPKAGITFEGGCEKPIDENIRAILAEEAWRTVNAWFKKN